MTRLQRNLVIIVWAYTGAVLLTAQLLPAEGETPVGDSVGAQQGTAQTALHPSVRVVQFSGVLQDTTGAALTGVQGVTFALYAEQTGGAPLWIETQSVTADAQGRYSVLLGSMRADGLPQDVFTSNEARRLGVRVNLPGAEEQPRVLLVSVPYALKAADAETLGGLPASAFLLAADTVTSRVAAAGGLSASSSSDGLSTAAVSGTGTTNRLVKWTDGAGALGDTVVSEVGGKIGIGTSSPLFKLHVQLDEISDYLSLVVPRANEFDHGFLVRVARGPVSAPTATLNGDNIFNLYGQGHDGGSYLTVAAISMNVDGPVAVGSGIVPGNIAFRTTDNTGTTLERLRVTSTGNIGIGTTSPAAKLDVVGDLKVSGNYIGNISSTGTLALPNTANVSTGVLTLGGNPFLHNFGANNTFIGQNAGNFSMSGIGFNTAIGAVAFSSNTTGFSNTAIGVDALNSNTIGFQNTGTGAGALLSNIQGNNNTATGYQALNLNTANGNTADGVFSLHVNTTGFQNTATGNAALTANTTGSRNTSLGFQAGGAAGSANANTTGSNNTFIGSNAGPGVDGTATPLTNATAIGSNAVVSASNALVLGSINGVNGATSDVNVGIGTSSPLARLQVAGGDVYLSAVATGVILKSPDGTKCARISLDNSGALITTIVSCL